MHSLQRDISEMTHNSSNFGHEILHYLRVLWPWSISARLPAPALVASSPASTRTAHLYRHGTPCHAKNLEKSRPVTHSAIICPQNDVALKHSSQSDTQAHKVFDQSADLTQMSNCNFPPMKSRLRSPSVSVWIFLPLSTLQT